MFKDFNSAEQYSAEPFRKYMPVVTGSICLISIGLFIGINLEDVRNDWTVFKKWGSPSSSEIFNGSYWGLISSNFLHTEIWHIAFNLYWIWIFGKKIEFENGIFFMILLVLSSALVSSSAQLSFSENTGIGLSGIGYSFFGYIFIMGRSFETYRAYLDKRTINLFLVWLVVCIALTQMKIMAVGNAAHIGGLLWGMLIAFVSRFSVKLQAAIAAPVLLLVTSMIFWTPFTVTYLSHKAYELHASQKIIDAEEVYLKILEREPENEFALENMKKVKIHKLSMAAFSFHKEGKYEEARKEYQKILMLDKDNEWALENLERLPLR